LIEGTDDVVFGKGALLEKMEEAEKDPGRQYVFAIKNAEGFDVEVRLILQELVRIGTHTHPILGKIVLPPNFQIIMTMAEGAQMNDESFYDRFIVKRAFNPSGQTNEPQEEFKKIAEQFKTIAEEGAASIQQRAEKSILVLGDIEIELKDEWGNLDVEHTEEMLYEKFGVVLDTDTIQMIASMQHCVTNGIPIFSIEGASGIGKTFSASRFARFRGLPFYQNPVSEGTCRFYWLTRI